MPAARRFSALCALLALSCNGSTPSKKSTPDTPTLEGGSARWIQSFVGPGHPAIHDVALVGGATVVVGTFQDTLAIADSKLRGEASDDVFVARFDADGALTWARAWSGPGIDVARAVAADPSGNLFVAGTFERALTIGVTTLEAAVSPDLFVAKLTSAGTPEWAVRMGGPGSAQVHDLATAADGGVIVVGFYDVVFEADGIESIPSAGMQDGFVVKLSADGVVKWARTVGGTTTDYAKAVAVNSRGDVVVSGQFRGEARLGDQRLRGTGARTDLFLATLAGDTGEPIWARSFGGGGADGGDALAIDDGDNLIVAGRFEKTAVFGGSPLEPKGGFDVFVAKYNAAGDHVWSRRLGGTGADTVTGLAVAGHTILVAGEFEGRGQFGGEPLVSAGRHDGFLAKYSAAGAPIWTRRFGGDGQDQLDAVAMGPEGDAAVVGSYHHEATFGDRTLKAADIYEPVLLRLMP